MRHPALAAVVLALSLSVGACGPSEERQEVDRQGIQASLESYLPLLAEGYATGNLEPLRGAAAEKEISGILKRVEDLAYQGRTLVPTFRSLTIEAVKVWNNSNAFVTTVEVWDLVVYATGSNQVLAEEREQINRVKYQLKREDGDRWRVLFRQIQE